MFSCKSSIRNFYVSNIKFSVQFIDTRVYPYSLFLIRPAQECQKVFKAGKPMDNDLVKGKVHLCYVG